MCYLSINDLICRGNKRKSRFAKDSLALANQSKVDAVKAAKFKSAGVLDIIKKQHGETELTPEQEQELVLDMMKVDSLCLKLKTVAQDAAMEALNPNRPPSPPPIYGKSYLLISCFCVFSFIHFIYIKMQWVLVLTLVRSV